MTKITLKTDCGNSPKREFLKNFNIAYANCDVKYLSNNVTEDIIWNMVGDKKIVGKTDFQSTIKNMKEKEVAELILQKIVTHGKDGAVNGIIKMKDGSNYAFSDFYEFKHTKSSNIKTITSYVIKLE